MIHRLGRVPDWYRVGFDRVWFAPDPGEANLLERHLPSEGKGHTFESCRARQFFLGSVPDTWVTSPLSQEGHLQRDVAYRQQQTK
jgi:hypothetical protein